MSHQNAGWTRREFLSASTVGAAALALTDLQSLPAAEEPERQCILLFLTGGPSQLDTWDLKPHAPSTVRGPFRPIQTNVPGLDLCEHFPRMATQADRFAIVRSVQHSAAPIHETGQQLLQTGHLCTEELEHPHYGSVLSYLRGSRQPGVPPFVVLPTPLGTTGVNVSHGQGAGYLGAAHEPLVPHGGPTATERETERYGRNLFGRSCLQARQLVEAGVRVVTVNQFETVFNEVTWDCHADGGALASNLDDYQHTLCPVFDRAYSALLDDLQQRGLLETTLVVAMGEFGRTPYLNPRGGRDHWPGVWSVLFAGGGVRGGQVVGSSDRLGAEPRERPVTPAEVAATIYKSLWIDHATRLPRPPGQQLELLVEAQPIHELFA